MKILLGTKNENKVKEFQQIFKSLGTNYQIISLNQIDSSIEEPLEEGKTFEENAIQKAKYYYSKCKMPVLSDDSGLEIEALYGMPGIYSARYASTNDKNAQSAQNRKKVLKEMEHQTNRVAQFVCAIAFVDDKNIITANGVVKGTIEKEEKGNGGFGYDSIFYVSDYHQTMAELDTKTKNSCSHRYYAIVDLVDKLKKSELV